MRRFLIRCAALLAGGAAAFGDYTNVLENGMSQTITNAWDAVGDMIVGDTTSSNALIIVSGGSLTNINAFIGKQAGASNNTATVGGSNALWHVSGSLAIGSGGSNCTLAVNDSGTVFVGQDLLVQNNATLGLASLGSIQVDGNMGISDSVVSGSGIIQFGTGANTLSISGANTTIAPDIVFDAGAGIDQVNVTDWTFVVSPNVTNQYRNFESLAITDGTLAGFGTLDAFDSTLVSGGRIAPDGHLVVEGSFAVANNPLLQLSTGTSSLHLTDTNMALNLSGMSAEITIGGEVDPSALNEVVLTADGGLSGDFSSTTLVEHFLLYDFALTNDATTMAVVSEVGVADGDIGSALTYAGIQGVRAGFNGVQNAAFIRTKQLRRNSVATDDAISNEIRLILKGAAPDGPQGPGDQNTIFGMHFWADHFSGQGDYDAMGNSDGFTLNNNGTSFGLDRLVGDSLAVGATYAYARSDAAATGGDRSETETYWLGLYAEWFTQSDYYLEGLLAFGWSDYETIRIDTGYQGEGSFEGNDFGGHLEGGRYFHHKNWAVAPYAGMNYLGIKSDAYTEIDQRGGPPLEVDGQSTASLESALGVKLRNRFDTRAGRFQTVGYAEWAYDFINDDIGTTLSDGTVTIGTARIAPGASVVNAGVGLSWICTDYLEVGLGYDGRFNENYEEHMGSIMIDVRF